MLGTRFNVAMGRESFPAIEDCPRVEQEVDKVCCQTRDVTEGKVAIFPAEHERMLLPGQGILEPAFIRIHWRTI